MKKISIVLILLVLSASCDMNSPDAIRQRITRKKDAARRINDKITELEDELAEVDTSEDTKYLVPVSLKTLKPESFEHYFEITGRLEAEADAFISPETNGQIKTIHVEEGQYVKKGQLLVSLNTSVTESSIREVETGLELATRLYEKQKDLWDQNIGSEIQYLEAKNAKESAEARLATLRAQLDMARITAPFSGVVESIMLREGELASPGIQVIQLVSLKNLKIYGDVSERYIGSLKKGDVVLVSFPDLEGLSMKVPIYRVGNVIDDKSRTYRIEMKLENNENKLKPNMYTTILINDFSAGEALVVPSIAIKQDIQGNYLYVAREENGRLKARKRYVTSGMSYNDQTMVTGGLSEEEDVIIEGSSLVSDGVEITTR